MDEDVFFRLAFVVLFALLTLIRGYYKIKAGVFREKLFSKIEGIHIIFVRAVLGIPLLIATLGYILYPEKAASISIELPFGLRFFGVILAAASLTLLVRVHHALGRNFSTTILLKRNHKLITSGPYRYVRHPMYSSYFMIFVSAFLISRNLVIGTTGLGIIILLMTLRLKIEETLLIKRFGSGYEHYMMKTKKFFPGIRRKP